MEGYTTVKIKEAEITTRTIQISEDAIFLGTAGTIEVMRRVKIGPMIGEELEIETEMIKVDSDIMDMMGMYAIWRDLAQGPVGERRCNYCR